MIQLLLDENLPRSAASRLAGEGWRCDHVLDHGLGSTDDAVILEWARKHGRVLVTEDADFPALLALGRAKAPSVVFIRIPNLHRDGLVRRLTELLPLLAPHLEAGAIVSVEPGGARVRAMPILPP